MNKELYGEQAGYLIERAKAGEVWLYGDLNDDSGSFVLSHLIKREADANAKDATLHIHDAGGDLFWAFAICDFLRTSRLSVKTVAHGWAASAGCLILVCGRERITHENAVLFFHGPEGGSVETWPNRIRQAEHTKKMLDKFAALMAAQTKKPKSYWRGLVDRGEEGWFTADEALELGMIDEIRKPQ